MPSRVAFRDRTLQRVLDFTRMPVRVKQSRTAAEVLVGYVRVVASATLAPPPRSIA